MDSQCVPTGVITPVKNTPLDFTNFSSFADKGRLEGAILMGGKPGLDHCFVNDRKGGANAQDFVEVATLRHEDSGREMKVWTTQASTVVYTANHLPTDGSDGDHRKHAAVCLETMQMSDAVNNIGQQGWPSA